MKSNSKEVKTKVLNHIIDYIDEWDNGETIQEKVIDQVNHCMNHNNDSVYHTCIRLVEGGSFMISSYEQRQFINSLNLNNNSNKVFDDMQVFKMYCLLLARELETIYYKGIK